MGRRTFTVLITCAILLGGLAATASPASAIASGPCSKPRMVHIQPYMGRTRVARRVKHLIACAERVYPSTGGLSQALCVAHRESRYWPWAHNESSDARGLFQHLQRYWPGRVTSHLRQRWMPHVWQPSAYNARANVLVTMRMARSGGWGPWGGWCG